jgi:hypothetical protein
MKKLFAILIMLFAAIVIRAQEENVQEIIDTANSGYMSYLELIPTGQESFYGFKSRDEFAMTKIGKPYQIFTLSQDFFSDASLADSKNYLVPTKEWRIPVMVNGENRTLVTVAIMNGKYAVVGIGGTGLSKELEELEKNYPTANQEGKLLRVYQLECDFLLLPSDKSSSDINAYPMTSAKMAFYKADNKMTAPFYSLFQTLLLIKNNINNK